MTETPPPVIEAGIANARARTAMARGRLVDSLLALKDRLMPGALLRTAAHAAADKTLETAKAGLDAARHRPVAAGGLVAALGLLLARKPIVRALSHVSEETDAKPARSPRKSSRKAKP